MAVSAVVAACDANDDEKDDCVKGAVVGRGWMLRVKKLLDPLTPVRFTRCLNTGGLAVFEPVQSMARWHIGGDAPVWCLMSSTSSLRI